MDVERYSRDIRGQVGTLHRRRHPSKGVVVEFEGFQEAVDRRTRILRALTAHKGTMIEVLKWRNRVHRNTRRWTHIRDAVRRQAPVYSLSTIWQDGTLKGIAIVGPDGLREYRGDRQAQQAALQELWADSSDGFVVFHSKNLLEENLASLGLKMPDFIKSVDTSQVSGLMPRFRSKSTPTSVDLGAALNVERDDFASQGEFLLGVFGAMVREPMLFGILDTTPSEEAA